MPSPAYSRNIILFVIGVNRTNAVVSAIENSLGTILPPWRAFVLVFYVTRPFDCFGQRDIIKCVRFREKSFLCTSPLFDFNITILVWRVCALYYSHENKLVTHPQTTDSYIIYIANCRYTSIPGSVYHWINLVTISCLFVPHISCKF